MIDCAPLWVGEELAVGPRVSGGPDGAEADAPVAVVAWGWQAGWLQNFEVGERCIQLGFGLHLQSVDHEGQIAPVLRLGLGQGQSTWRGMYVQAGPSWDGERAGLDVQLGYDWTFAALYAGYSYGDEQVVTIGVRVPVIEAIGALIVVAINGFYIPT